MEGPVGGMSSREVTASDLRAGPEDEMPKFGCLQLKVTEHPNARWLN